MSGGDQSRSEAFGTDVVERFPDQAKSVIDRSAIGAGALAGPRLASEGGGIEQTEQALAMQSGDGLHLGEQEALLRPVSRQVTWQHAGKVLTAFGDGQRWYVRHGPSVTVSVVGTIKPSVTFYGRGIRFPCIL